MFDDDVPQHPDEEGTYTPEQIIRMDFEALWLEIIAATRGLPASEWAAIAEVVINTRLRLYERAGLLRAAE
jgi:hypothetical protein